MLVCGKASSLSAEFFYCKSDSLNVNKSVKIRVGESKWLPPCEGCLKVNVDGSFKEQKQLAGFGVVVRNAHGILVDGCCGSMKAASSFAAEALGMRRACQLIVDAGWKFVVIESDCLTLIDAVNNRNSGFDWRCSSVISDIVGFACGHKEVTFSYVPRQANRVADWVAKEAARCM